MAGCPTLEELRQYLTRDGALEPEQVERIEVHVELCDLCQGVMERLTAHDVPQGTTLPHLGPCGYRVYKFLGGGAFGEVWLAQDLNLPRVVAVKTLKVNTAPDTRARALEALRNDAQLLADVDHHNVVRVHAWLTIRDQHYLVMQHVAGGSLADRLTKEGPLDWQPAARYVADVGEGLLEVHTRGIVHRDVKPANILWDPRKDEALLTDFGVAARLGDAAALAGSIPYMAPEAFDGEVSPSLDVYSLASTLFHLVTGSPPFPGPQISDLKQQIPRGLPDPDPRCQELPEPLERVIRAGLTAEPARRPAPREFVAALRGALNQLLADTMSLPLGEGARAVPADLRVNVSRQVDMGTYEPVASTHPFTGRLTRDMKKVPAPPEQFHLRTGDRVRVEVVADRQGYITVFNVGPAGALNLLHPADLSSPASARVEAHRPLHVVDVELTPPAGRERLFAIWARAPLPLNLDQLQSFAEGGELVGSRPYRATRDMKRVQESVRQFPPEDRSVMVLELDHDRPGPSPTTETRA
jgi:serine/threonine protein kinase